MVTWPLRVNTSPDLFHECWVFLINDAADILKSLLNKHVHLLTFHNTMGDISFDILRLALRKPKDQEIVCSKLTVLLEVKKSRLLEVIEDQLGLVNVLTNILYHLLQNTHRLHVLYTQVLLLLHY